jgi:aryl-alcohol dehydrogenase-like predicted oxidoreductase
MRYRRLGASGLQVSELTLGTYQSFGVSLDQTAARALTTAALDVGINAFDTADVYADGEAERMLGRLLGGVARDRVVLVSKCFMPRAPWPNAGGLSRKNIHGALEGSLRRLRTDYLDVLLCHRFDETCPLEETVDTMSDLVRQGKLRYWGVSRWNAEQMVRAHRLAHPGGVAPIANQYFYHLLNRGAEALLARARLLGMGLMAYSPLAGGVLSGKYAIDGPPPPGSRAADEVGRAAMWHYNERDLGIAARVADLARQAGTSAAALALRFCLRLPEVATLVCGATKPEQILANAAAIEEPLSAEMAAALEELRHG